MNTGIYFGVGLASLTILIMTKKGWRFAYELIGFIGIGGGLLVLFIIREPERNRYDQIR